MEASNKVNRTIKALTWTGLVLGLSVIGYLFYDVFTAPKTLYGKEIVFENTYYTSAQVEVMDKRVLSHNCMKEVTSIVATQDTIEITTPQGKFGLKPVELTESQELRCLMADGTRVVLIRYYPEGKEDKKENEVLYYISKDATVVLMPGKECQ